MRRRRRRVGCMGNKSGGTTEVYVCCKVGACRRRDREGCNATCTVLQLYCNWVTYSIRGVLL